MRVLIVVTSCDRFEGSGGARTGVWLESFVVAYYACSDAGLEVVVSSPLGGPSPVDPASNGRRPKTAIMERYNADPIARADFADTLMLSQTITSDFSGAYYADGAGAHIDLTGDANSHRLITEFGQAGRPCAFVGHATAALLRLELPDGAPAIAGRRLATYGADDQAASGLPPRMLPLAQDLSALGAICISGPPDAPFMVADGNWITGQNAASSAIVAQAMLAMLR